MSFNTLKTVALLGGLTALLLAGGELIGGRNGLYMGLVLSALMNFASYFFSEKIALSMYRAQPVTPTENTNVYYRVYPLTQQLCQAVARLEEKNNVLQYCVEINRLEN